MSWEYGAAQRQTGRPGTNSREESVRTPCSSPAITSTASSARARRSTIGTATSSLPPPCGLRSLPAVFAMADSRSAAAEHKWQNHSESCWTSCECTSLCIPMQCVWNQTSHLSQHTMGSPAHDAIGWRQIQLHSSSVSASTIRWRPFDGGGGGGACPAAAPAPLPAVFRAGAPIIGGNRCWHSAHHQGGVPGPRTSAVSSPRQAGCHHLSQPSHAIISSPRYGLRQTQCRPVPSIDRRPTAAPGRCAPPADMINGQRQRNIGPDDEGPYSRAAVQQQSAVRPRAARVPAAARARGARATRGDTNGPLFVRRRRRRRQRQGPSRQRPTRPFASSSRAAAAMAMVWWGGLAAGGCCVRLHSPPSLSAGAESVT